MIKKTIKLIIILIISIIIGNSIYGMYKEIKISNAPNKTMITNENSNAEYQKNNVNNSKKSKEIIPEKYKGYMVSSKIVIPKINLETYVLDEKQ